MEDDAFDRALIGAWFTLAADSGRQFPTVVAAAQAAGLPLDRARARFPSPGSVLMRFGRQTDQAALMGIPIEVSVRDKLFDVIMRRIDALQAHRAGVNVVLRQLPAMPPLALLLGLATERSMRWLLDACGVSTAGIAGALRVRGLVAVWLWTVRAWQTDESMDLSTTMAALDRALGQAERAAGWLGGSRAAPPEPPPPMPEPDPLPPEPLPPEPVPPNPLPPVTGMPESPAEGMPGLEQPGLEQPGLERDEP
jgi:ubiquinone biosynthesis protein COQ9